MRTGRVLLRWVFTAAIAVAAVLSPDAWASEVEALVADIETIAREGNVRGGGYAIIRDDKVVVARTFGHMDAAGARPVSPSTLFRVGSISKMVTSLLAMALVEDGTIALDTPVTALLPDADIDNPWWSEAPLRLVHLLEQTGGLPGSSFFESAQVGADLSPADYLKRMQGRLTLRWPPGRHYSYANGGHTIAARMLEAVTGETFDALVKARVLAPLGMSGATYSTRDAALEGLSTSFYADGSVAPAWRMAVRPSGSLAASLKDMAKLVLFLASDGASAATPPVSPAGLKRMRRGATSLPARNGYDYAYGLGMFGFVAADRIFWGHWGKTEGFLANLGVLPQDRAGFVLLSNTSNRRAMAKMRARLATFTAHGLSEPAVATAETTAAPSDAFTGLYMPFTHDMALRGWLFALMQATVVFEAADGLTARPLLPTGGARALTAVSERFFRAGDFPVATHLFLDDDGQTVLFGDGQETYRRLTLGESIAVIAGLALASLAVVISLAASIIVLVGYAFGRPRNRLSLVVLCFGVAATGWLALIAAFAMFDLAAPLHRTMGLGAPGTRSFLLFLLSLFWPLAAALGIVLLIRRWRDLPRYGRTFGCLAAAGYLTVAGVMIWQYWLPLVTWRA
ncbi:MAG: beta-lactamase family protein [Alphaproteobacteria bacterium]|nr:beta-lactamase family protein [Alphaproteobacteria bacterium]